MTWARSAQEKQRKIGGVPACRCSRRLNKKRERGKKKKDVSNNWVTVGLWGKNKRGKFPRLVATRYVNKTWEGEGSRR